MRASRSDAARYLVAHPGAELYGSDRVMIESVAAMVEDGASVTVTLPEDGPLVALLTASGASVRFDPALVLRKSLLRPRNWFSSLRTALRAVRTMRQMLGDVRPDAVYVSTMTLPLWPLYARWARVPTVLHLHEGEQGAPRIVKWAIYAPAAFAQRIVVNSEFSRGVLGQAFRSLAARAHVVYNGVAGPPRTTPAPAALGETIRLVYIGRLSPRKGPDLIVEALAKLDDPRVHADLVGAVFRGYEWYEKELRERIIALDLDERVKLLGFRPEVWDAVDDGDMVVVPSRLDEPFGNTAVEGTLAGRVVVVSDTSGLREATEGVTTSIRFTPGDVDALVEAIREAIAMWPELEPRLADQASAAALRFSPATYRARIAESMRDVIRPPAPRRRGRASRGTT